MSPDTDSTRSHASLPAGAQAGDVVTAVLIAIAMWWILVARPIGLFNGLSGSLSPVILFYIAGSVQVVRHLLWPTPSVISRLKSIRAAIAARPHVSTATRAFLVTRPAVFGIGFAAVITIGMTSTPDFVLSRDPLANLPARFDAGWYGDIALDGYHWDHTFQRQRNIAFFPAMPMLMRPLGAVLGMYDDTAARERRMLRALWAGLVISLVAFFWSLYYLSRLAADLIGPDRAPAATLLLAAYPFALFFNAPYTEALFLLGSVGACYHFLRGEWLAASVWGLLVGLTRPNGCFLSVTLAILAILPLVRRGAGAGGREWILRIGVAAMPGVGMLLFTLYLYRLTGGVWFAWARSHEAWGRSYQGLGPVLALGERLRDEPFLQLIANNPFNAINALGVLFALVLTYPVFRKVGLAWGVFVLVNLLPPLFAGGFISMGRLTSTLFPLFLALGALLPPRAVPAWAVAFGIGQGFCATLFFTWHALY